MLVALLHDCRLEVTLEKLHVGQLWPSLLNNVPRAKQTLPLEEGLSYNDELTPEELKMIEERLLGVSEIKRKRVKNVLLLNRLLSH